MERLVVFRMQCPSRYKQLECLALGRVRLFHTRQVKPSLGSRSCATFPDTASVPRTNAPLLTFAVIPLALMEYQQAQQLKSGDSFVIEAYLHQRVYRVMVHMCERILKIRNSDENSARIGVQGLVNLGPSEA